MGVRVIREEIWRLIEARFHHKLYQCIVTVQGGNIWRWLFNLQNSMCRTTAIWKTKRIRALDIINIAV